MLQEWQVNQGPGHLKQLEAFVEVLHEPLELDVGVFEPRVHDH